MNGENNDSLIIDLWTRKHEISSFTAEYIKKTKRRWDQMVDKPTVNDRTKLGFTPCGELSNSPHFLRPIKLPPRIDKKRY